MSDRSKQSKPPVSDLQRFKNLCRALSEDALRFEDRPREPSGEADAQPKPKKPLTTIEEIHNFIASNWRPFSSNTVTPETPDEVSRKEWERLKGEISQPEPLKEPGTTKRPKKNQP
jgi:hypothetical protein